MRSFPHNITSVIGLVTNVIITVHDFSPYKHPDWFFQNVNLILDILPEISLSPLNICTGSSFTLLKAETLPAIPMVLWCPAADAAVEGAGVRAVALLHLYSFIMVRWHSWPS